MRNDYNSLDGDSQKKGNENPILPLLKAKSSSHSIYVTNMYDHFSP